MKKVYFAILWGIVLFLFTIGVSHTFLPFGYNSVPGGSNAGGALFTTSICSGALSGGKHCIKIWPLEILQWLILVLFILLMSLIQKRSIKLIVFLLLLVLFGSGSRWLNKELSSRGYFAPYYQEIGGY